MAARGLLALFHSLLGAASGISFSSAQTNALLILGTLAGELPDIDLIYFYFARKHPKPGTTENHRDYITHTPLFWLLASAIIFAGGFIFGTISNSSAVKFIEFAALFILAGTWCHLIFDSIEYGVRWLYPFSRRYYCLKKSAPEKRVEGRLGTARHYWDYINKVYLKTVTFWVEIAMTALGVYLFLN